MTDDKQPTDADIEMARAQFKPCDCGEPDCAVNRVNSTLDRALDALAREQEAEKRVLDTIGDGRSGPSIGEVRGFFLDLAERHKGTADADYYRAAYSCWTGLARELVDSCLDGDRQAARIAALEARLEQVRWWQAYFEDSLRGCSHTKEWKALIERMTMHLTEALNGKYGLDGKATPASALPTILLDALKAGTIAEEAPERHWMVMQDPDGSWAAWSCGAHEGYRLHNDKCGLTREQAEDEGRASGLRPFDGKVTP